MVGKCDWHHLADWPPNVGIFAVDFVRIAAAVGIEHFVDCSLERNWFVCDVEREVHSIANCLGYGIGPATIAVVQWMAADLRKMLDFDLVASAVLSFRRVIAPESMVQRQYCARSFDRKLFGFDSVRAIGFVWQTVDAVECRSECVIVVLVLLHLVIDAGCHR